MLPEEQEYQHVMDELLKKVNETEAPRPIPPSNNGSYIMAVVLMLLSSIGAIVVLSSIRPDLDFVIIVSSITAVVAPTTLFLLTFLKQIEGTNHSKEANLQSAATHVLVNSRMKLWVDAARKLAYAEGIAEGRRRSDERTDLLTSQAKDIATSATPAVIMPVEIVSTVGNIPVEIIKGNDPPK